MPETLVGELQREMADTTVDFFLENLMELLNCDNELILNEKDKLESLYEELVFLRKFLKEIEEKRNENEKVKNLVAQITDVAYEAEDIVDLFVLDVVMEKKIKSMSPRMPSKQAFHPSLDLSSVVEEINFIKTKMMEISGNKLCGVGVPEVETSSHGSWRRSPRISVLNVEEEIVVGFDHEVETIKERLVGVSKQLEVISIVGMAGLGKTTLARKLYNDPYVVYHFYIRGWISVSQVFQKRDLLLGILSFVVEQKNEIYKISNEKLEKELHKRSFDVEQKKEIYKMSDEKLGEELYKHLKGKRYLVVMDDIWHIEAWSDLKNYFPNDKNGSRIIFTTRITALQPNLERAPHFLRFLTKDESWDLLRQKVFGKGSCPLELVEIGKQIARKCQGLPLAIVVVAGLLAKTDKIRGWWKQVAESVSSYIVSDPKQYIDTLELSYNHLPPHLKSCFLFMGAFPEDYEIPVQKLIRLWVAEGFIRQTRKKRLEDIAKEYLMDLIDRNLVLVAKKGSAGGIKACHLHDLLRELCLRKAEEENFLKHIYKHEQLFSFFSSKPRGNKQRRMCIRSKAMLNAPVYSQAFGDISPWPSAPHVRSFLCTPLSFVSISFIHRSFKLLRVLDLSPIKISSIPTEIVNLVHLRYLAIRANYLTLPPSISELYNLETLIAIEGVSGFEIDQKSSPCHDHLEDSYFRSSSRWGNLYSKDLLKPYGINVPETIWKMVKLRHLYIPRGSYIKELTNDIYPSVLDNLQTISQIRLSNSCKDVLARTPNLKRLGFSGGLISKLEGYFYLAFPDLSSLNHLEILKLSNWIIPHDSSIVRSPISCIFQSALKFPPNLKKLTLEATYLSWEEMSILGMLPNLEVLKLMRHACIGQRWETSHWGFRCLKFLKLDDLDIAQWKAYSIHFPSLQHLVLCKCEKLEKIPSSLGDIPTLQILELSWCSRFAMDSARQIQEEQQSVGNDLLKVLIRANSRRETEHGPYQPSG